MLQGVSLNFVGPKEARQSYQQTEYETEQTHYKCLSTHHKLTSRQTISRRLAQTPVFWCLRSRRQLLFRPRTVESILSCAMPFYPRVYSPGELQFITTSTYRRTPLFLSDRFRRSFVQRLEERRQEWRFLLTGLYAQQSCGPRLVRR